MLLRAIIGALFGKRFNFRKKLVKQQVFVA